MNKLLEEHVGLQGWNLAFGLWTSWCSAHRITGIEMRSGHMVEEISIQDK
jgi:hypothetical protein